MPGTESATRIPRWGNAAHVKSARALRFGSALVVGIAISVPLMGGSAAAAPVVPPPQWPAFHGNDQRTSISYGIGARLTPTARWHFTTPGGDAGTAPVIGKYVYTLVDSGRIDAFNPVTGVVV